MGSKHQYDTCSTCLNQFRALYCIELMFVQLNYKQLKLFETIEFSLITQFTVSNKYVLVFLYICRGWCNAYNVYWMTCLGSQNGVSRKPFMPDVGLNSCVSTPTEFSWCFPDILQELCRTNLNTKYR